jgi:hypothetical protein
MRNKIPRISNEDVISVFSTGVFDIKMREKLSVNDELTSVVRLFEIADRCAKAEEGRLFVHNLPEVLPPKPKSKDPKCKEAIVLAAKPDHKQRCGDRSERDKGRRHRYCILHKRPPSPPGRLLSSWSMGQRLFFPPMSSLGRQECSLSTRFIKRTSSRTASSCSKKLGAKRRFTPRGTSKDYAATIAAMFRQGLWRSAIWC